MQKIELKPPKKGSSNEEFEKYWEQLRNVGYFIDMANKIVALL